MARVERADPPVADRHARASAGGVALFGWARVLASIKTCRVRRAAGAAGEVAYERSRSRLQRCAVSAANLYLRGIGSPVRILRTHEWVRWECDVHRELNGLVVRTAAGGGGVIVPGISGRRLSDILASDVIDVEAKALAMRSAAEALARAHRTEVVWPDGVRRAFSHGDATAENVLFDPATGHARWIDFETLHDPSMSSERRQADDFRALIFSAAASTHRRDWNVVVAAAVRGVPEAATRSALGAIVGDFRPDAYEAAQMWRLGDAGSRDAARMVGSLIVDAASGGSGAMGQ